MHTPHCREATTHPALIEALAADVNALREARRITFEQAYDTIVKPEWVREYEADGGNMADLGNRVINKAKGIGRARGRVNANGRRVADFNTIDDLIAHARDELGATHVGYPEPGTMQGIMLYFPRRDGQYEAATAWKKDGYWHAQGPGKREIVRHLPRSAQPLGGRRTAERGRGRAVEAKKPRSGTPVRYKHDLFEVLAWDGDFRTRDMMYGHVGGKEKRVFWTHDEAKAFAEDFMRRNAPRDRPASVRISETARSGDTTWHELWISDGKSWSFAGVGRYADTRGGNRMAEYPAPKLRIGNDVAMISNPALMGHVVGFDPDGSVMVQWHGGRAVSGVDARNLRVLPQGYAGRRIAEAPRRRRAAPPPAPITPPSHDPPPSHFTSAGGRVFTLGPEEPSNNPHQSDVWPIFYNGDQAGKLFHGTNYGPNKPWHATTRELHWQFAASAPLGIGFDTDAFATAQQTLDAWGRSADQILDWSEGKPVVTPYSHWGRKRTAGKQTTEAPRRGGPTKYRPGKGWRDLKVARVVPNASAHQVEFEDGLSIQVHSGSGRSDLLYAMKPYDMRLEKRSPGPERRRDYQYVALRAVLGDRPADFVVDRDGDVMAYLHDGGQNVVQYVRPGVGEARASAGDSNFQQGERLRIRVIGPKGQLADPPFWYTVPYVIDLEELALQFSQTIQPGMFVSISDGKNSWTFQKETHGGQNAVRRTHKLPTARYRENVGEARARGSARGGPAKRGSPGAPRQYIPDPEPDLATLDQDQQAEAAGARYASDQINSDHFNDWVHDQLLEASKLDPSERLPLETKADAMEIARNMFQELEWDTKRQLGPKEIARLIDGNDDDVTREMTTAFYKGFRDVLDRSRGWLADELLESTRKTR